MPLTGLIPHGVEGFRGKVRIHLDAREARLSLRSHGGAGVFRRFHQMLKHVGVRARAVQDAPRGHEVRTPQGSAFQALGKLKVKGVAGHIANAGHALGEVGRQLALIIQMDMGIDEPRHQKAAGAVHHQGARFRRQGPSGHDGGDTPIFHAKGPIRLKRRRAGHHGQHGDVIEKDHARRRRSRAQGLGKILERGDH